MKRKTSRQREMILDYLMSVNGHPTAEEIFKNMNAKGTQISLATVYRNLGILEEMHKIRRVAHPEEGYCYDRTSRPHHHLHCIRCNQIYDLPLPYEDALNARIASQCGMTVFSHSIMAEGICEHCRRETDECKE